jgi:hypothetical protein
MALSASERMGVIPPGKMSEAMQMNVERTAIPDGKPKPLLSFPL